MVYQPKALCLLLIPLFYLVILEAAAHAIGKRFQHSLHSNPG